MPPKRKQVDDAASEPTTSTRSTRASTRSTTAKNTATAAAGSGSARGAGKAGATGDGDDSDGMESIHSAKKARTSGPAAKRATKGPPKRKGTKIDDETVAPRKVPSIPKLQPTRVSDSKPVPTNIVEPPQVPPKVAPAPVKKPAKVEPYTPQRALELFATYADEDDTSVIGPEGFEKLCNDAEMPMEGTRPLIFAWQMNAKEMGKVSKDEWVKGMAALKISSISPLSLAIAELEDVLFKNSTTPKSSGKEYDRALYSGYASNPKAAFQKLYMFSFNLVKPEQSKNIDMETSTAFWTVLLVPKYPIMEEIVDFINTTNEKKNTYKAANKDLWSMMLEFCETVKPSLQDYEADAAWPTLLDDFVAWKMSQKGNDKVADGMDID